ncbi:gastrula zinc finger protein XlCGF49.1-like isoform X2 [Carassius carassius]|uniref:gastrula zinc finger protein XlCGF49.1-like isoform X2 n=1 Tax=Carassius carassius TaxID=217509 RepID=UPI002868D99B|nr:gastrula zinc finger protein XlCGF49.1-like isoform X2 [Carassius carassius]
MAFIKVESEDMKIEETIRLNHEDTEEQTDLMAPKEEREVLNENEEEDQYDNLHDFTTEERSCFLQSEMTSTRKGAQETGTMSYFTCFQCGKTFSHKGKFNRHMTVHSGKKPFKCNECGKSFSQKGNLNKHMRIHDREKPFICKQCGRRFKKKGTLDYHILVHTGKKPFICPLCRTFFKRKQNLKSHMKIHTEEKLYTCPQCEKSFKQKRYLEAHMRRIHTGEMLQL